MRRQQVEHDLTEFGGRPINIVIDGENLDIEPYDNALSDASNNQVVKPKQPKEEYYLDLVLVKVADQVSTN